MTSSQTHPAIAPPPPQRVVVRKRRGASREQERLILLIQAGWVAVGLIAVASFPDLKIIPSNLDKKETVQSFQPTAIVADPTVLFTAGSESIVARAVGHAEGTRTPDGNRTPAYFGHVDPGNGVWNLGSFSFQHCREARYQCSTPEQADAFQLKRLQTQTDNLQQRATSLDLKMTLEEELNAIDLANQAPLAALGKPGYPEHLQQARKKGLKGQAAVLKARVQSFWDSQENRWDAPGLGNTETKIRHDQNRRMLAIARVLTVYQQQPRGKSVSPHHKNWFTSKLEANNPYSFQTQRNQFLWWDAGYWDAKLNRGRQLLENNEPAYDQGFQLGAK
ncbi:hypothetical protein K9N68_35555 (plasmid) [Kovacikia minuta CCNUW1]|uniref:hypothetical protein n=1 Tax=Kovacikia minuta TaxID=2931930 RepID=UPI001CCBC8CF|nr:hypothetical protein [Kovacikia minuta]UBF30500.1 hypothetical protein K9N68_35555 [Kovacikia minuta CCNUW1]